MRANPFRFRWLPWLDVLSVGAWGVLLLKYWLTGKLVLLIHPNYLWLSIAGGFALSFLAALKTWDILRSRRDDLLLSRPAVNLFPATWSHVLLLMTAVVGFIVPPQPFASDKALRLDVASFENFTRSQPQAFAVQKKPEERSLVEWIRTLSVYPEPDAYTDQKVNVIGFAIHPPELSPEYLVVGRFILTCCAADAYPIGLPVKLSEKRDAYPPDTWLQIEGQMMTETFRGDRQLVIRADKITQVDPPQNPYEY